MAIDEFWHRPTNFPADIRVERLPIDLSRVNAIRSLSLPAGKTVLPGTFKMAP
jgi:hypothetical protein